MSWPVCTVCWENVEDDRPRDDDADRCPFCGQLPVLYDAEEEQAGIG